MANPFVVEHADQCVVVPSNDSHNGQICVENAIKFLEQSGRGWHRFLHFVRAYADVPKNSKKLSKFKNIGPQWTRLVDAHHPLGLLLALVHLHNALAPVPESPELLVDAAPVVPQVQVLALPLLAYADFEGQFLGLKQVLLHFRRHVGFYVPEYAENC